MTSAVSRSQPWLTSVSQAHGTNTEFGIRKKCGHEIVLSVNLLMFPWLSGGQTNGVMDRAGGI